jgi:hypothetical protein
MLTTCVGTVAMFVVDSKSTVIKLKVQELETHLLGKEFSGKPQMCKEVNVRFVSFYFVEQVQLVF